MPRTLVTRRVTASLGTRHDAISLPVTVVPVTFPLARRIERATAISLPVKTQVNGAPVMAIARGTRRGAAVVQTKSLDP